MPAATRDDDATGSHLPQASRPADCGRCHRTQADADGPSMTACGRPATDLANRADVEALLRRFYGRAFDDDVLDEPFSELRAQGLDAHLRVMCDFWETVLFRAGLYRGNALTVHRQLSERHPLGAEHVVRWLTLWDGTVDEMYRGPVAERAKIQAARIARSMHRRLTASVSRELDSFVLR
jgi:hemoglobin